MRGSRILLAALIALALLGVGSSIDWRRLSVDGLDGSLNDQVGYISVARRLADHGRLESGIIYPSLLLQHARRNTLYMPGFYWVLAVVFKLFGYSAAIARIPSIVSFLLASALCWWIAARLYSDRVAHYGCALFAFFPICLVYAFTAMAEMTLVAAGLAAFALFLRARDQQQTWLGPLVLALPIVFRETGVLIGSVMLPILVFGEQEHRWRRGIASAALMLVVLAALLWSPVGAGRPSLWKANILGGGNSDVVYASAYAADRLPHRPSDWVAAIHDNFTDNVHALWAPQEGDGFFEESAVWFILTGIPLGLFFWFRRRDAFALGTSLGLAALLLAVLAFYAIWGYHGLRVLLIFTPFVAILWGRLFDQFMVVISKRVVAEAVVLLLCGLLGTGGAMHVFAAQAEVDQDTKENTAFLESVVRGDDQLLVSPYDLSLDYVNQHYPVRWAFVPSDCDSMRLLEQREHIGTLVLEVTAASRLERVQHSLCGLSLTFDGEREFNGTRFWIFHRDLAGH